MGGPEIGGSSVDTPKSIPQVPAIPQTIEKTTSVQVNNAGSTVFVESKNGEKVEAQIKPGTTVITEKSTTVDTKLVSGEEAKKLIGDVTTGSKSVVSSAAVSTVVVPDGNTLPLNVPSKPTGLSEPGSKLADEQNKVLIDSGLKLSELRASTQKTTEVQNTATAQAGSIIPVGLTNGVTTISTPVIDPLQSEVLGQIMSEASLQENQLESSVVVQKTPITIEQIVEEKVIVDVNVNKLSFKGTRFEKREDVLKYGSNYIFDDAKGKQLLEEIRKVMDNPTKEEEMIVTGILNNYKTFFDKKNLEEKKIYGDSRISTRSLNENISIAQEIVEKGTDLKDNKMIETRRTKTTKTVYGETRMYQKLNKINPQVLAAKSLLGDMSRGFESKIVEFYKTISLDKLLKLYNKTQNSSDKEDAFNAEIDALIGDEVLSKLAKFKPRHGNKSKYREFRDIIIKQKKMIAQTYFKHSTFFVSSFIQDTQKGKDYFGGLKDTKENETVKNLIRNPDFNFFSQRLNDELVGIRKKRSTLQLNEVFAHDAGLALLSLVIKDKKDATSLLSPGIVTGGGLYQKNIEFKKGRYGEFQEGLFLGGARYNFSGINDIKDIVIYGDSVVISMHGNQNDIKIKKQEFINGIQNLVLKGVHEFVSEDGMLKFNVKGDKTVSGFSG